LNSLAGLDTRMDFESLCFRTRILTCSGEVSGQRWVPLGTEYLFPNVNGVISTDLSVDLSIWLGG